MPVHKRAIQNTKDQVLEILYDQIIAEFREPKTEKERPVIILMGVEGRPPTEIYVIWDAWEGILDEYRTEVIMDAYKVSVPDDFSSIYLAMGMTRAEGKRAGMI